MQIKYLGHASFFIKSKGARLVIDPYGEYIGLKFPRIEADIVTVSHAHADHNAIHAVAGNPLIIDWPGEYEKMGVRITGYKYYHDKDKGAERGENVLFKIEADELSILHCGDLGTVPEDKFLDEIGEVDVLMVPVGGFYTIDSSEAIELIKKVEPAIVIPMHYNRRELDQKVFEKLTGVEEFLKKMGVETKAPETQLNIKKEDLEGEMKVVVMEISN